MTKEIFFSTLYVWLVRFVAREIPFLGLIRNVSSSSLVEEILSFLMICG